MWYLHVHGFLFGCACVFRCLSEDGLCSPSSLLQVMVVDGDSGMVAWSYSIPCHMEETPATSAAAVDQKSVFLFWAEGLSAATPNPVSEPGRVPLSLCQMAAALGAAMPGLQWAGRVSWGLRLGFEVNKLRFRIWAGPQGGKAGAWGCWAEGEGSPGASRERSSDTRKAGLRMS